MQKIIKHTLIFILITMSIKTSAQDKQYFLALSKGSKKLLVLDYKTLDSVTSVAINEDPHEIVTTPDGSLAYISHPILTGMGNKISVVNLKSLTLEKTINTSPFYTPHGLAYNNNKLWFTAQGSKAVAVYNTEQNSIDEVLGTGQNFTHLIQVMPDGNSFYTTNVESGTLSIYEKKEIPPYMPPTGVLPAGAKTRVEWQQTLVNVGVGAEGFDVSADGKELWTARPDGYIVIVDLAKKIVKKKINSHVQGLHRLKITPDGKSVAIVSVKTGDLLFYNSSNYHLEEKMNIGQGAGIYMDTVSNRMFISCTPNNYIVAIDLANRKIISKINISRPDAVTSVIVKQHP